MQKSAQGSVKGIESAQGSVKGIGLGNWLVVRVGSNTQYP